MKARRESQVLLGPLADARDEDNALGDMVCYDGVLVGRVPVRVFERLWRRRVGLLVACGEGLKGEGVVVVMQSVDDVLGR